jgi:hypothetical protein
MKISFVERSGSANLNKPWSGKSATNKAQKWARSWVGKNFKPTRFSLASLCMGAILLPLGIS